VGLAASIATVNFLIDHGTEVYGHLEKLGQQAEDGMNAAFLSKGIKGVVTRLGSAMSFYFMDHLPVDFHDLLLHHDFDRDLAVRRRLVEEGVFVVPVATKQISISSAHTERDIEMLVKKFEECLI
jgi:glutamate-1-semialdehyde 2,1-aminomutase